MNAFWLGVASSLAAWLVGLLITNQLIPVIQGLLWSVTDVSGHWLAYIEDPTTEDPTTHQPVGDAYIKQRGPRVTMSLHRYRDTAGNPTTRNYRYKGVFRARQLTILWEALDRPDFRLGAMVLHLSEDGTVFKGLTVFYDDNHHGASGVGALNYWLKRAAS